MISKNVFNLSGKTITLKSVRKLENLVLKYKFGVRIFGEIYY